MFSCLSNGYLCAGFLTACIPLLPDHVADAKLIFMRWIVYTLILTILISGYSDAAHAFGPLPADKGQVAMMGMDCGSHQKDAASDNTQDENGNAAELCDMSCHHCCAGHAMSPASAGINAAQFASRLVPAYAGNLTSGFVFSLLRPPRNLV